MTDKNNLMKIGIGSIREIITRGKVVKIASKLDRMDPEVAKKMIEQFPEFSNMMKNLLAEYRNVLEEGFKSNDASMKNVYDVCNTIITGLQKELDKDNLSFEEKKYIIEQMMEVAKLVSEKDSENKKFVSRVIGGILFGFIATITISLTTMGGDTEIEVDDI